MAFFPASWQREIKSDTNNVTNQKYIDLQVNNAVMPASKYVVLGASVTGNYLCFPYIVSNNWRVMFFSINGQSVLEAYAISGTCTFYYIEK